MRTRLILSDHKFRVAIDEVQLVISLTESIHKNGKEIRGLYIQLIGTILNRKDYMLSLTY